MARKASGGGEDVAGELKAMIATLRRRPMFFAIMMDGRTPIIRTHVKKKPRALKKEAKSAGGGPKGCSGQAEMNGKILQLHCVEEGVPDTIAKLTTKYFRENGLQFKVEIMPQVFEEPEGEEVEEAQAEAEAPTRRQAADTEEATAAPGHREAAEEPSARADSGPSVAEEAGQRLREAGIETGPSAATDETAEAEAEPEEEEAPAAAERGRTEDQNQLMKSLKDMQSMLQKVREKGKPEDQARMKQFGDLFKRAVSQNDARVGHKVLDGMRQLSKQVEIKVKEVEQKRAVRINKLDKMKEEMKRLIDEMSAS